MDNPVNRVTQPQQLVSVPDCSLTDLRAPPVTSRRTRREDAVSRAIGLFNAQRVDELFEKERDAVLELHRRRSARWPQRHFSPASGYKFVAVVCKKYMKHGAPCKPACGSGTTRSSHSARELAGIRRENWVVDRSVTSARQIRFRISVGECRLPLAPEKLSIVMRITSNHNSMFRKGADPDALAPRTSHLAPCSWCIHDFAAGPIACVSLLKCRLLSYRRWSLAVGERSLLEHWPTNIPRFTCAQPANSNKRSDLFFVSLKMSGDRKI